MLETKRHCQMVTLKHHTTLTILKNKLTKWEGIKGKITYLPTGTKTIVAFNLNKHF